MLVFIKTHLLKLDSSKVENEAPNLIVRVAELQK